MRYGAGSGAFRISGLTTILVSQRRPELSWKSQLSSSSEPSHVLLVLWPPLRTSASVPFLFSHPRPVPFADSRGTSVPTFPASSSCLRRGPPNCRGTSGTDPVSARKYHSPSRTSGGLSGLSYLLVSILLLTRGISLSPSESTPQPDIPRLIDQGNKTSDRLHDFSTSRSN